MTQLLPLLHRGAGDVPPAETATRLREGAALRARPLAEGRVLTAASGRTPPRCPGDARLKRENRSFRHSRTGPEPSLVQRNLQTGDGQVRLTWRREEQSPEGALLCSEADLGGGRRLQGSEEAVLQWSPRPETNGPLRRRRLTWVGVRRFP